VVCCVVAGADVLAGGVVVLAEEVLGLADGEVVVEVGAVTVDPECAADDG
jgi:hypothetical protein